MRNETGTIALPPHKEASTVGAPLSPSLDTFVSGMGSCSTEAIVDFKRQRPAKISYAFIVKRFDWYGYIPKVVIVMSNLKSLRKPCMVSLSTLNSSSKAGVISA